uniref:ATP-dependent DNA helicase n=1 Tax=Amphimedon queenslandica TaxID=400682 RepID=A0A1X7VHK3_AMPQE
MFICQITSELEPVNSTEEEHNWAEAGRSYPDIGNALHFIHQGRQNTTPTPFTTSAAPDNLKERHLDVCTSVKQHFESIRQEPLHIINGTAVTGKLYLINCLRLLLGGSINIAAPTQELHRSPYVNALQLFPTVEAVVDHNVSIFCGWCHPIAAIKAVHTGANAAKAPPDYTGGLEPVVILARSARVMLTGNLWVVAGLVNGAMGTAEAICYKETTPPHLPVAVMVQFDHYTGPTVQN